MTSLQSSLHPYPSPRLLAMGFQISSMHALLSGFGPGQVPRLADVTGWDQVRLLEAVPGAQDAIVLEARHLDEALRHGCRALHARFAALPMVAMVRPGDASAVGALLRLGVHETFERFADLPGTLERARARVEAAALWRGGQEVSGDPPLDPEDGFQGLFPNLFDWIYVVGVSEAGAFTFETVNSPVGGGSGFLSPDFTGRTPEQCMQPASADLFRAHFIRILAEGRPLLYEEKHEVEGHSRSFQTTLTPVRNKWGRIHRIAAISRDITALKEAEAALSASEQRLNLALEGTQQSLWDWNLITGEVYRNPRWFSMLGLSSADIAPNLEAGLSHIHPEDRQQVEGAMNAHLEGRQARFQAEYRLQARSGEWIWVFDAGKVVAWDAQGRPARVTGMCTDITERRRAEESLRALVGGVVHEIRNPVYGIVINLDALDATFGADPRFLPFIAALRESAERISSLMNDLKDYGEPRTLNPEPCLVRGLLDEAARSCEVLLAERRCAIQLDLEDPELVLPVNGRRMHQVFRNLLENALHHSPQGGLVRVRASRESGSGHTWWTFTVTDDGDGFGPESLSRAFEPFFTRRKGGTGLGLSIVKRVVEEHGGTVEVGNRPEGGAVLTVNLPAPRHGTTLFKDDPHA